MLSRETLKDRLAALTRIDKLVLIALVLRIAFPPIGALAGFELPAAGLVRLFFIVALIIFLIGSFPRHLKTILWRVRHRLLATWIFVGVVPIVLIAVLVLEIGFMLMGQIVGYMTSNEIARESEAVRDAANTLGWSVGHSGSPAAVRALVQGFLKQTSETRHADLGAIVRTKAGVVAVPESGAITEIPHWSNVNTAGLIRNKEKSYYFGAHVASPGPAGDTTEVFLYEAAPAAFFANLLPGVAAVRKSVGGSVNAEGVEIEQTEEKHSGISFKPPKSDRDPVEQPLVPPPGRGSWDRQITWIVLIPVTDLETGNSKEGMVGRAFAVVASRPSLVVNKLFSTLGGGGTVVIALAVVTAIVLFIVEVISAFVGFKLTRSITRAVADLDEGTRRVRAGDFSHRIPVRKTRDQLSELGASFNTMTAQIEDLIQEVKEKERLENELEIAREVQSQLFPKEFPQLNTLQLWGGCQPARMVSGDYYDFVRLGSDATALAIGDISGKGISAALLMAHIQSALRSQLEDRAIAAPSTIISILNNHLYKSSPPEKYATFFLGIYSDEASQLTYTNAGHLAPIIVRRGEVLRLAGDGFPVGMFPGMQYDQQVFGLESGDVLAAFTDGITETPNRDGEEFGDQRLMELLLRYGKESLEQIANEVTTAVGAWAGSAERHDDTTIILAKRLPS